MYLFKNLDIDECTDNTDGCDYTNGGCTNTPGSFTCTCNTGYELNVDGTTCDGKYVFFDK